MIKAIETNYKGYRFRSRLEARWAVFFDRMGMRWEYEPEGFELPDGTRYLPDFRFKSPQGIVYWYEIKPRDVDADLKVDAFNAAARAVAQQSGVCQSVTLLSGDPLDWLQSALKRGGGICPRCGGLHNVFAAGVDRYGHDVFVGCEPCDDDTPIGGGHPEEPGIFALARPHKGWIVVSEDDYLGMYERAGLAAHAARGARFEHGESGVAA